MNWGNGKLWRGLEWLLKKPFRMFFLIAGAFLFFGLSQLHISYVAKYDYTEITGEICNVTPKKVLLYGQYVIRYAYDLIWYADGEEYKKHFEDQADRREEGVVSIWVQSNNQNAFLYSPAEIKTNALIYLSISIVSGILAIALYWTHVANRRESVKERMERLENNMIGSIIGFIFSLFGIGLSVVEICKENNQKGGLISTVGLIDWLIVCIVSAVICLIIFLISKKQSDACKRKRV